MKSIIKNVDIHREKNDQFVINKSNDDAIAITIHEGDTAYIRWVLDISKISFFDKLRVLFGKAPLELK